MLQLPDLLEQIRKRQSRRLKTVPGMEPLPPHEPEMLYIGCVDARLDPIDDIGIPKGKALIYRNIGALVPPQGDGQPNPEAVSVGAVLEFFLKHIPAKDGKVKHIVVSGHTHCGGIKHACAHDHDHDHGQKEEGFLMRYLSILGNAIRNIFKGQNADTENAEKMREVEHESVRRSIDNLMKYDVVREALKPDKNGKVHLQIHGWVIDTATQHIEEMKKDGNEKFTGEFGLMGNDRQAGASRA